ncbi:hypothetical protein BH10CYA1_BH10CYA1_16300 [soil metagenome]
MRRSLMDMIRGLFHSQVAETVEPVKARVENARMTCNRLKALKHPTAENNFPVAVPAADPNDPHTISKRVTTLAHMSHYRLAAYVATLPSEVREECEDSVLTV